MDRPKFLSIMMLVTFLLGGCLGRERISKTEPQEQPQKVYRFDNNRGCYLDGIVNGNTVSQNDPLSKHMVMIVSKFYKNDAKTELNSTLCTGTLISSDTILTAAHCFPNNTIDVQIVASINLFCASGFSKELIFRGHSINIHPSYVYSSEPIKGTYSFDIATIKFDGILPPQYEPIPLQYLDIKNEMTNSSSKMIMIGFGNTSSTGSSLPELRYLTKNWNQIILQKNSVSLIDQQGMIGVTQQDSRGGCRGDSGGPLLIESNGSLKIAGVASYIEGISPSRICEDGQLFYTYIPSYWNWLSEQL